MEGDSSIQAVDIERSQENLGTNQSGMRAQNERLVLSLVRRHGRLAKAEIARITGLSAQTVSVIMRALESDGLLLRGEKIRGKVGQPSVPMELAPEGAYFFGLKVGRRSADLVLIDFLGRIVDRVHQTYTYPTPDSTLAFAAASIDKLVAGMTPTQRERLGGLGIAIPFFMWEWASIIGVADEKMADWRSRDVRAELEATIDMPVYLENDMTSACGAELVFGNPERLSNFLYFYVGHLIGGGLVLNGGLFTGPTGNAGALGPMPMSTPDHPGRQLVDVASLAGLESILTRNGVDADVLWEFPETWAFDDALLEEWMAEAMPAIAHAIVTAASLVDVENVLVDGWLPDAVRTRCVAAIEAAMNRMNLSGLRVPRIMEGSVGPDARALGAASLPLSKRFMPIS